MIIPSPKKYEANGKTYELKNHTKFRANSELDTHFFTQFWNTYFCEKSEIEFECSAENYEITAGNYEKTDCGEYEYALNVTDGGICLTSNNKVGLIHAFTTLIQLANITENGEILIPCCKIYDKPSIDFRAVHLCVFPETKLDFLQKCVRLCGMLKISHIILEFWGMYKFECMKELSWDKAFTKSEIEPIIHEANALGIEIIPMFNHLGHASQSRVASGKHVVLDQNPTLSSMFEEDGWTWNYENKVSMSLLSDVRNELMSLCGNGKYFHLGFDEPYSLELPENNKLKKIKLITSRLNEFAMDLDKHGRRPIIWGDMLLFKPDFDKEYSCNAQKKEYADFMLCNMDKKVIIADWQYDVRTAPVKSADYFSGKGFDVLLCPWNEKNNIDACTKTAVNTKLYGEIFTTWHTLRENFGNLMYSAVCGWNEKSDITGPLLLTMSAALQRKVNPAKGVYENCGWWINQINGANR